MRWSRSDALSTVIASEAKQSRASHATLDCFVAEPVIGPAQKGPDPLAPRNDNWGKQRKTQSSTSQ